MNGTPITPYYLYIAIVSLTENFITIGYTTDIKELLKNNIHIYRLFLVDAETEQQMIQYCNEVRDLIKQHEIQENIYSFTKPKAIEIVASILRSRKWSLAEGKRKSIIPSGNWLTGQIKT